MARPKKTENIDKRAMDAAKEVAVEVRDAARDVSVVAQDAAKLEFEAISTVLNDEQKLADTQIDYMLSLQREFAGRMKEAVKDMPNKDFIITYIDQMTKMQEDYVHLAVEYQERIAREALDLSRKSTEKLLKSAESMISHMKV